jgi:hypothetical protein
MMLQELMIEIGQVGQPTAYSTNKVTFQYFAVGTRFLKIGNGIGCADLGRPIAQSIVGF